MGAGASAAGSSPPTLTEAEIVQLTPAGSLVSRAALENLKSMQDECNTAREV